MLLFVMRRLFYLIFVVISISIVIFLLVRVIPGDPVRLALGQAASKETIEQMRKELGMDKPLLIQYKRFVENIFKGKLGISLKTRKDVSQDLKPKIPATLELIFVAFVIAIVIGTPLGIISAVRQNRTIDYLSRLFALTGVSFPEFWMGIMFQIIFAYSLGLLPLIGRISGNPPQLITGFYIIDSILTGNFTALKDTLVHLVLPALTLSLSPMAQVCRLSRANMIEELRKDYTIVSRTLGLPEWLNLGKYMLKKAFTATLTIIGFAMGVTLGGAFVVETVFAWPGMARYGANAIIAKDYNAIVAVVVIICICFSLINFVVDLLSRYLDPRIGLRG